MTDETLLFRQVNPAFIQDGRPSSQVFRPIPKDEYRLSVYDGDLITAEQSWKHFTKSGLRSAGVLAVNVRECKAVALSPYSSPEVHQWHAHIDFTGLTNGQIKAKGTRLLAAAETRGWQHQA